MRDELAALGEALARVAAIGLLQAKRRFIGSDELRTMSLEDFDDTGLVADRGRERVMVLRETGEVCGIPEHLAPRLDVFANAHIGAGYTLDVFAGLAARAGAEGEREAEAELDHALAELSGGVAVFPAGARAELLEPGKPPRLLWGPPLPAGEEALLEPVQEGAGRAEPDGAGEREPSPPSAPETGAGQAVRALGSLLQEAVESGRSVAEVTDLVHAKLAPMATDAVRKALTAPPRATSPLVRRGNPSAALGGGGLGMAISVRPRVWRTNSDGSMVLSRDPKAELPAKFRGER